MTSPDRSALPMKASGEEPRAAGKVPRSFWRQAWLPRQTRVLTKEELEQVGKDTAADTLSAVASWVWLLLLLVLAFLSLTHRMTLYVVTLAIVCQSVGYQVATRLWREQLRHRQVAWSAGGLAVVIGMTLLLGYAPRVDLASRPLVLGLGGTTALALCAMWWAVVVYRAHQIEAWLNLQAEQHKALDIARQLATAQIQPHFLFNSLASLQHWVQAKDDRAAPLLQALTGFLRATLPLFNRKRLALGEEAEVVRQYLAVMHLRLGERLRYSLSLTPEAAAAQVPPGLLLTLVENAVEHGVMPSLGGADVTVQAHCEAGQLHLSVHDTGPGLPDDATEGVGLANTRARLLQAFGLQAHLRLANDSTGGCVATLQCPLPAP